MTTFRPIRRIMSAAALAAIASATLATTAGADVIKNSVVVNGVGVGNQVTVPEGTDAVIPYRVEKTGPACDAADGTPVTVTINVPAGVSANPASLVFASCDVEQSVTFSAPPGTYDIPPVSTADAGGGDYSTGTTPFVLRVEDTTGPEDEPANTAPVVTVSSADVVEGFVEGNTTGGAIVSFSASAVDAEDGPIAASCDAASPSFFALGARTVTCSAIDSGGLEGTATLSFEVGDTTPPTLTVPADISQTARTATGNVVEFSGLSAVDVVDPAPVIGCVDTALGAPVASGARLLGTHVIRCTATDASGNQANASFTVRVLFEFLGFYQPIDVDVRNSMRAGSTAPMKFRIADGAGGYISDLAAVVTGTSRSYTCTNSPEDSLEEYATGGTALRYDATAQQYIFNWQSPRQPGTCWQVKLMLADGTARYATFSLR